MWIWIRSDGYRYDHESKWSDWYWLWLWSSSYDSIDDDNNNVLGYYN